MTTTTRRRTRYAPVTDEQITALMYEGDGDAKMARICERALSGSARARRECQRVIDDARAQDDGPARA